MIDHEKVVDGIIVRNKNGSIENIMPTFTDNEIFYAKSIKEQANHLIRDWKYKEARELLLPLACDMIDLTAALTLAELCDMESSDDNLVKTTGLMEKSRGTYRWILDEANNGNYGARITMAMICGQRGKFEEYFKWILKASGKDQTIDIHESAKSSIINLLSEKQNVIALDKIFVNKHNDSDMIDFKSFTIEKKEKSAN